jgi:hypothetical protein
MNYKSKCHLSFQNIYTQYEEIKGQLIYNRWQ